MRHRKLPYQIAAPFLICVLTLPSPASALRPQHVGLEEIEAALSFSTGLEESDFRELERLFSPDPLEGPPVERAKKALQILLRYPSVRQAQLIDQMGIHHAEKSGSPHRADDNSPMAYTAWGFVAAIIDPANEDKFSPQVQRAAIRFISGHRRFEYVRKQMSERGFRLPSSTADLEDFQKKILDGREWATPARQKPHFIPDLSTGLEERVVTLKQLEKVSSWSEIFGNDRPVALEIGPDKGEALEQRPAHLNILAVEPDKHSPIFFPERLQTLGDRVKVIQADIRELLEVLPEGLRSLEAVYIDYPPVSTKGDVMGDPFILEQETIQGIVQLLAPGGQLVLRTTSEEVIDIVSGAIHLVGTGGTYEDAGPPLGHSDQPSTFWSEHYRGKTHLLIYRRPSASEEEFIRLIFTHLAEHFHPLLKNLREAWEEAKASSQWGPLLQSLEEEAGRLDALNLQSIAEGLDPQWASDPRWQTYERYLRYITRAKIQEMYGAVFPVARNLVPLDSDFGRILVQFAHDALGNLIWEFHFLSETETIPTVHSMLDMEEWDRLLKLQDEHWRFFAPLGDRIVPFAMPTERGMFNSSPLLSAAELLKETRVDSTSYLFEAGHGLARVLSVAAFVFGAKSKGRELDPEIHRFGEDWIQHLVDKGLLQPDQVELKQGDFSEVSPKDFTHLYAFPADAEFRRSFEDWVLQGAVRPGTQLMILSDTVFSQEEEAKKLWPRLTTENAWNMRLVPPGARIIFQYLPAGLEERGRQMFEEFHSTAPSV